jgi:hypothetical protein
VPPQRERRRRGRLCSRPKFEPPPPTPHQLPDEELEALGLKKPEIKRLRKVLAPRQLPLPLPACLALSYCSAPCPCPTPTAPAPACAPRTALLDRVIVVLHGGLLGGPHERLRRFPRR